MAKTRKQSPSLGSYKALGIDKPKVITANDVCPICNDAASKRKLRNPCAFEVHTAYLAKQDIPDGMAELDLFEDILY